jgi:hypothetical protein
MSRPRRLTRLATLLILMATADRASGEQPQPASPGTPVATSEPSPSEFAKLLQRDRVPIKTPFLAEWQRNNLCGLNSVYLMLRLLNRRVSYATFLAEVEPVNEAGLSLAEMRDLAERLGLPCEVVRGSPSALDRISPPAVFHLGEEGPAGHFVVFYAERPTRTGPVREFTDGTTGLYWDLTDENLAWLTRNWSGYVLVPRRQVFPEVIRVLACIAWALTIVLWCELGLKRLSMARRGTESHGPEPTP